MSLAILPGRFFARLRSFELACPRCGDIYSSEKRHTHYRKIKQRRHLLYDPITQIWRCPSCNLRLTLGIIAWRVEGQALPPEDTVPNLNESKQMREKMKEGKYTPEEPVELPATIDSAPNAIVSVTCRERREPVNAIVEPAVEPTIDEDDGDVYQ